MTTNYCLFLPKKNKLKTIIIIPARYRSSRFPGKPLAKIANKEMIIHVAEKCAKILPRKNIYIATENKLIFKVAKKYGFNSVITSAQCLTGTDRVAEVEKKIKANIYINVQGDEPVINPRDILKVLKEKQSNPDKVICGYTEILKSENPLNLNLVKVVFNKEKKLIYCSRSIIPGTKIKKNDTKYYKQVCIYAFNNTELKNFSSKKKSLIESIEDIEILRFFEHGIDVKLVKTSKGSIAVDTKNDLRKVRKFFDK